MMIKKEENDMKTVYITLPTVPREREDSMAERERRARAYSRRCYDRWVRRCENAAVWSFGVSVILLVGVVGVKLGTMLVA